MTDCEDCEELREALGLILRHAKAYPTDVFPEVTSADWFRARDALKAIGLTVDRLSADAMRHALRDVGRIAEKALR